jgi:hypothetical protein
MFGLYVVLTLVLDSLMVISWVDGTWRTDSPLVDGYVLAGALLGASALHPSMVRLTGRAPAGTAKVSRVRIGVLLALATLVIPLLVTVQKIVGRRVDVVAAVAASVALSLLAMLRMSILVQDLRRVMRGRSCGGSAAGSGRASTSPGRCRPAGSTPCSPSRVSRSPPRTPRDDPHHPQRVKRGGCLPAGAKWRSQPITRKSGAARLLPARGLQTPVGSDQ